MSGLFPKPPLEPDTIEARPYQAEAIEAVRNELRRGITRTLIVHPMGTGKTIILAKIARAAVEKKNRTLVIAQLSELINQMANAIERVGILPGIEKAGAKARALFDPDVVVGSVASLQGRRLASWPNDYFRTILVDEAHHAICESYQAILRHFPKACVVGVSATPDRADGERIDSYFQTIAHEFSIYDAICAPAPGPYLCGMRFVQADVGIDLRELKPGKGDFSAEDLDRRIKPLAAILGKSILQEAASRPTMVFTPGVDSATAIASALRSRGASATWVAGDSLDRDQKIGAYKAGEIQFLVSCQLLLEGFDAPLTGAVALCQPTQSRARLCQMIGRGLRLHPCKSDCLVIDFDYLTATHSLVRPADLFMEELGGANAARAATKDIAGTPGLSLTDVIQRAKTRQSDPLRTRREIEVRADGSDVHYRSRIVFDPLGGTAPPPPPQIAQDARHDLPSERMVAFLKARGHTSAARYSRRYAGKLIGLYKAAEAAQKEAG